MAGMSSSDELASATVRTLGARDRVAWLRRTIEAERSAARDLIESEAAAPHWHEMTSGVLVTGPSTFDDAWDGVHPIGDSRITRFIADRDPESAIARCEADLAILDEHGAVWEDYRDGDGIERTSLECSTCEPPGTPDNYPCRTVRLLASGYRHRPGYEEAWGS